MSTHMEAITKALGNKEGGALVTLKAGDLQALCAEIDPTGDTICGAMTKGSNAIAANQDCHVHAADLRHLIDVRTVQNETKEVPKVS